MLERKGGSGMANEKLDVPKPTKGDVAHALAKAGLSAIPIVGGPAVELFQLILQPPLEKRRIEWMAGVGSRLWELQENGLKLEELQSNEQFISAVLHASQVALSTHQAEKLAALRNALMNIAEGYASDEEVQHHFFQLIESFTGLHLRMLKVAQAPKMPEGFSSVSVLFMLERSIPGLRGRHNLGLQFWRDLYTRGLVKEEWANE